MKLAGRGRFLNEDSVLCRTNALGGNDARSTDALFEDSEILVLPDSVVDEVLHAYHDSSHYGIARLAKNVSRRYHFEVSSGDFATIEPGYALSH